MRADINHRNRTLILSFLNLKVGLSCFENKFQRDLGVWALKVGALFHLVSSQSQYPCAVEGATCAVGEG